MKRRNFIKKLGLTAAYLAMPGCAAFPQARAGRKTNFVFILIDDMGYKDPAFMGSSYHHTPRIDNLAAEGVVFTNAYANAPNCAPTRACLISGQYSPRHGIYTVGSPERGSANMRKLVPIPNKTNLDTAVVTLPQALKAAGYATACIGKWHLGDRKPYRPQDRGFDVTFERQQRSHFTADGRYLTDVLTDRAIDFIRTKKDVPFFLYLSHYAVHTPIQAKKDLIEKYESETPGRLHNNPKYAAMIDSVDQSVGRILDELDRLALAEDTVVFFFSDNGGYANVTSMKPLRGSKGMLYEGGIRVPLIIRCPRITNAPRKCNTPVIGIDFYPTILNIAGVPGPPAQILDGESILPLLKGRDKLDRKALFWHFPAYLEPYNEDQKPWRMTPASAVRAGPWKLIEFFEDSRIELYNLDDDIGEKVNLADANPERAAQLLRILRDWRKRTNAPVPTQRNSLYSPPPNGT
ncbi:MAG: sulfatase [Sedimentisphaerales bacterium]|nr:sulfatase [Sedimentisphaerales bacterium]